MIDIRYHIATLIAIFLALGVGILIGSTVVGSDVLVDQQKKIIDQLESQFEVLRQQEADLSSELKFMSRVLGNYEDFNRAILPPLVKNRLGGYQVALIITGGEDVPAGMLNSLALAGARVTSTTVILPDASLTNESIRGRLCGFYGMDEKTPPEELRVAVANSVSDILLNRDGVGARQVLQKNNLVKFQGNYAVPVHGVILLGGADDTAVYFPETVDIPLIRKLVAAQVKVFGVEVSQVEHSYMQVYQRQKICTVDDIDIIPGQVALILAMEGEPGDYGVKPTAKKFMPSLPPEYLGGTQ